MRREVALLAGVAAGSVAAVLLRRRATPPPLPAGGETVADPRAEELRRKLAEAREGAADEGEFEAAGMGPETLIEDGADDVAEARRRVHDEARATAEEMRRAGGEDEAPPAGDAS